MQQPLFSFPFFHIFFHGLSCPFAGSHGQDYGGCSGGGIAASENARDAGGTGFWIRGHAAFLCMLQIRGPVTAQGIGRCADSHDHQVHWQFIGTARNGDRPPASRGIGFPQFHLLADQRGYPSLSISLDGDGGRKEIELDPFLLGMVDLFFSRR